MTEVIRPLPSGRGVGFFCPTGPLPEGLVQGYRHEVVGRYNNYYCTGEKWRWPVEYGCGPKFVIDAFAPNLNKELHAGHLRQLVLATSLQRLLPESRFVGMFGASLGVKKRSVDELTRWMGFAGYRPEMYYDVLMPQDVVQTRKPTQEEMNQDYAKSGLALLISGHKYLTDDGWPDLWDGPHGPVIVRTAAGKPLYALHDLCFTQEVGPTHYITDHGQREHFKMLGLADKHLPMGLVLGPDPEKPGRWTKLKSRTGDALTANDTLAEVRRRLDETRLPDQLAWNVLAWNFLSVSRPNDVKFEVEKWTSPDGPGLYITYTYARICGALNYGIDPALWHLSDPEQWEASYKVWQPELEPQDVELLGFAAQHTYWLHQARTNLDPTTVATFAHELARKLGSVYHRERIYGGRKALQMSVEYANIVLGMCMQRLGMYILKQV